MSNNVPFPTPKLRERLRALEEEVRFRNRNLQEATQHFQVARSNLAKATDEIGAPADGRTVVFMYQESALGPPGVYFETFDLKWNEKARCFEPRPYGEGVVWARQMAQRGVKIDVPPAPVPPPAEPQTETLPPTTREPVAPPPPDLPVCPAAPEPPHPEQVSPPVEPPPAG